MAGNSGGSGSAAPSTDMGQAMQQMQQAMQSLSAEQKQALESMGLSGMMGAGTGQAPQASQPAPPAGTAPSRPRPSSSELQSDDLTQMVQRHLQALGYDPGNTDGEMSLETTIAISQFQAEKGLEVTGEVSPQLAGILAAEVDK